MDAEPWGRILAEGPQEFTRPETAPEEETEQFGAGRRDDATIPTIEVAKGGDATMGQGVLLRNRLFFELF